MGGEVSGEGPLNNTLRDLTAKKMFSFKTIILLFKQPSNVNSGPMEIYIYIYMYIYTHIKSHRLNYFDMALKKKKRGKITQIITQSPLCRTM